METADQNQNEMDRLKEEALELGRRLGLLLAAAAMPDEQKQSWLALIPSMNAGQMAEFAKALEKRIPDAEEQAFGELAHRLGAGQSRHAASVASSTERAKDALADVERELKPPAA